MAKANFKGIIFYNKEVEMLRVIDGIGKDADVVTNQFGGKQSKAVGAMHLVDPNFLDDWFNKKTFGETDWVIRHITQFMIKGELHLLIQAINELDTLKRGTAENEDLALLTIAKVLQEGATKYKANNWRLIPQEEHINHAINHYLAYKANDTQDDHLEHCMCRLMMAYATKKSDGFSYTEYQLDPIDKIQN